VTVQGDNRREVALAEFVALREEILARLSAQNTLVGVCLTAVGVIFGLALSQKGVSLTVVLVVPPVVSGLAFFYLYNARAHVLMSIYLRTRLWPMLRTSEDEDPLVSWEGFMRGYRTGERFESAWTRLRWMSLEPVAGATVFLFPSVFALIACGPGRALDTSALLLTVWIVEALMVALVGVTGLLVARDFALT
jgi:hypothetical protein